MMTNEELNALYRSEGWGELAEKALGIPPSEVEGQARRVAQYAYEELAKLRAIVDSLTPKPDENNEYIKEFW